MPTNQDHHDDASTDDRNAPLNESARGKDNQESAPEDFHESQDEPSASRESAQEPQELVNPDDYAEEAIEREALEAQAAEDSADELVEASVQDDAEDLEAPASESEEFEDAAVDGAAEEETESALDEPIPGADGEADADSPTDPETSQAPRSRPKSRTRAAKALPKRKVTLVINDEPGDECRIAILADHRLDSYFSEREASATNVGSIYKGRVMNIEGAIQAAFIDFGSGQNGFLHISDLHPKYFPGEERTEQVGKKIGRSERPLIQQALRKGQEILVQVIKEGLGSKGPTLTSYLSLPGRLLVMMPDMDRVGVSRRVDDEDQRREMRKILDSLNLPEGFGFILRTAGFDSTKTELQRDAAYLQRLWDAMAKRSAKTGAPCELYTESDVLVRTLRDHTDSTVESIIVDSPGAFERAKMFLDVIAPKTSGKVLYYNGKAPIFEAYGIERQIDEIHSRTVPLPSGGALVFDQTEALVAIDVNSGRSRSARDSETNAYQTNSEAIEEVCRQLRLRDLGGLIVVDCIDMRMIKHRRDIEERLTALLKLDRAKSSFAPISEFGIIEMTRQRMRPSLRKMHYADCTHCNGSGETRLAGAVAADAMRRVALLFSHAKIERVEIVCSVRVAAELISNRRRAMHELEDRSSKRIDVRISEAFAADRVEMYAYDANNSDLELDRLPALGGPVAGSLHEELPEEEEVELTPMEAMARRRRRKRRPAPADATAIALAGGFEDLPDVADNEVSVRDAIAESGENSDDSAHDRSDFSSGSGGRGRRRRGRRGEQSRGDAADRPAAKPSAREQSARDSSSAAADQGGRQPREGSQGARSSRRRRGRGRRAIESIADMVDEHSAFETNRVAGILNTSVDELVERLRANADPEIGALLNLSTFMLPPELIARAQELYPQPGALDGESAQSGDDSDAQAESETQETGARVDRPASDDRSGRGEGRSDGGGRSGRGRRGGRRSRSGRDRGAKDGTGSDQRGGSRGDNRSQQQAQGGRSSPSQSSQQTSGSRERTRPPMDVRSDTPAHLQVEASAPPPTPAAKPSESSSASEAKPKRRSLYGAAVRLLSSLERSKAKGRPE